MAFWQNRLVAWAGHQAYRLNWFGVKRSKRFLDYIKFLNKKYVKKKELV